MKSISELAKTAEYIGHFNVTETEIDYVTDKTWSNFRDMGNIVYFMYVKGRLMKIGIAGGSRGWYGRVDKYKGGASKRGDATNRRILRVMKELGESKIDIYAVAAPKMPISLTCPLTGDIINGEVEVNRTIEQNLTSRYLSESELLNLPFSKQLK
jgi:hypothetical protein